MKKYQAIIGDNLLNVDKFTAFYNSENEAKEAGQQKINRLDKTYNNPGRFFIACLQIA